MSSHEEFVDHLHPERGTRFGECRLPIDSNIPDSSKGDTPRMEGYKSPMEAGSPEFAEDRTQVNSLNNKFLFDAHLSRSLVSLDHNQSQFDNLNNIAMRALNNSVELQTQINAKILAGMDQTATELAATNSQRARHADDNAYVTRYDLSNPVTTGAGDTLRSAAYTPNRASDVAAAGQAVNADAINAAVAVAVNTNLVPLFAVLQQIVVALTANQPAKA